jgi:hypothetical protein
MDNLQMSLGVIVTLVIVALLFDFMNGFHDAANSIATVVSTGVLKPQHAVVFATFFNVVAIFVFHLKVAATVGKGIVDPGVVDQHVVFGALIGAIAWNVLTWWYGIPSSSHMPDRRHRGCHLAKAGTGPLVASGVLKTVAFIFISPAMGFLLGGLMMVAVAWIFRRTSPLRVDNWFRRLQLVSAGLYSLGHGGNDAQKTIGIIWALTHRIHDAQEHHRAADLAVSGDRPGHDVRRLAHRQDDGPAHHETQTGGRFLCRIGRRDHALSGVGARHSGVDHAHHHRRDRRRRVGAARVGGALGNGRLDRLGLDLHDSGIGLRGRLVLLGQPEPVRLISARWRTRRPGTRRSAGR